MFHSNLVFADEKAFITADLSKLHVRRDPFSGKVPESLHCNKISARKRCNAMRSMRPLRTTSCNKTLQCTVSEEVGNADADQKQLLLNVR